MTMAAVPALGLARFHQTEAYLGYRRQDQAHPYAAYLRPEDDARLVEIAAAHARPSPPDRFQPFTGISHALSQPGYLPLETGWTVLPGGPAIVAVHTKMPGVRANMWDWWFAWHGSDAARYKLWAPSEHLFAVWRDGEGERAGETSYVGRTSLIKEHIGSVYLEGAIRFVEPQSIGFSPGALDGTVICGRAGEVDAPVEHTWLIHQVRNTEDGCEMRSRFYLGQDPVLTTTGAALPPPDPTQPRPGPVPAELLVHCAKEMHHLAGFLAALHKAFA